MELKFISAKKINGLTIRTDNATEMDPHNGKIGRLWQTFDETVPVDYKKGERVYGVYSEYESDHTGQFTVLAGFDGSANSLDSSLESVTIREGNYLVFKRKGGMPQIAIDAWAEVWNYFLQDNKEYIRLYTTDFEYYPNESEIEVHIAVE
ncbi:GyrI-like domain-containing protein [Thalassotalea hakodatensis]|uniref:GyrI-like domain-containing protein n=1 Tax=Thalassotalea hakodatensis TaxID=3030492 RepID=UPI0025731482|nr:GyrI-like domain-containing protein [Thalassotalea hakodatensis]